MHTPELSRTSTRIESDQQLADLLPTIIDADLIALDTEFVRRSTYYPKLALLQIASRDAIYLIDPLQIEDLRPLSSVLSNSAPVIVHSATEDLEVLRYTVSALPEPLFDTQIAAAFLGYGAAPGYANLLKLLFDLELDKSETRSDWLKRPLTRSQVTYAEEDVRWLPGVYDRFVAELESRGRLDWFEQECQQLVERSRTEMPESEAVNRFNVRGQWNGEQWARLCELAAWRERVAREDNRPRGWVIKDPTLISLAERPVDHKDQLSAYEGIDRRVLRNRSEELFALLNTEPESRSIPDHRPLSQQERSELKKARQFVENLAEELDISPALLAKKADIQQLQASVRTGEVEHCSLMCGWRAEVVGKPLLESVFQ